MASTDHQHLTPQVENLYSNFEELPESPESLEDDILVISEPDTSLENALCLNQAYQSTLLELSQQLDVLRLVNQQKQKSLAEEIEALTALANEKQEKQKKKKISFSFFGMPYFKDAEYNCAPKNEDTLLAESIGFRNVALVSSFKPFSKNEVKNLRSAVREQALAIEATRLVRLREFLQNELAFADPANVSEEGKKCLEDRIEDTRRKIFDVNSLPDGEVCDLSHTALDWQKIAIEKFRRSRTPEQLRLHWMHYIRPGVNCRNWSLSENKQLKELVKNKENGIDWEIVAQQMNSNRTAFDCFRRYQERFNAEHRKFGWTQDDNKLLISLISNYSEKNICDIDWEDIRLNFPGKSKSQIYAHFRYHTYSLDASPFTVNEDVVILEGVKMGYDFASISLLLGKRSAAQVRNRYKVIQHRKQGVDRNWTERENTILLNMKDSTQLKTHIIRRDFPGRTFAQLYSRFHYLRMRSTTPQKYIEELRAKSLAVQKKKMFPKGNKSVANKIITMMYQSSDPVKPKGSVKNTLPILKHDLLDNFKKNRRFKAPKGKRTVVQKQKELKEILRPLMSVNSKRPRKLSFPGDGREHGIILTSLYRLLQCNFTLAPKEEPSEEEMDELGISPHDYLPFVNLLKLKDGVGDNSFTFVPESIVCLPPTLNTLTGFRGLLLHRKYLQTSASAEYNPPERRDTVQITECPDERTGNSVKESIVEHEEVTVTETESSDHNQTELESLPVAETVPVDVQGDQGQIQFELRDREGVQVASVTVPRDVNDHVMVPASEFDESNSQIGSEMVSAANNTERDPLENLNSSDLEEDDEDFFGDRKSDSLLLSRLLTLFYWPGIMSTIHVPEELIQPGTRAFDESINVEEQPQSSNSNSTPGKLPRKDTRKEVKERRKRNIKEVIKKRFGNKGDEMISASTNDADQTPATSTPPPPKKKKVVCESAEKPKRRGVNVQPSDRVTRRKSKFGLE